MKHLKSDDTSGKLKRKIVDHLKEIARKQGRCGLAKATNEKELGKEDKKEQSEEKNRDRCAHCALGKIYATGIGDSRNYTLALAHFSVATQPENLHATEVMQQFSDAKAAELANMAKTTEGISLAQKRLDIDEEGGRLEEILKDDREKLTTPSSRTSSFVVDDSKLSEHFLGPVHRVYEDADATTEFFRDTGITVSPQLLY